MKATKLAWAGSVLVANTATIRAAKLRRRKRERNEKQQALEGAREPREDADEDEQESGQDQRRRRLGQVRIRDRLVVVQQGDAEVRRRPDGDQHRDHREDFEDGKACPFPAAEEQAEDRPRPERTGKRDEALQRGPVAGPEFRNGLHFHPVVPCRMRHG
ncbi:MAG: hypothetical protein ACJ75T_02740 [Solirubrobacterales bacterium]